MFQSLSETARIEFARLLLVILVFGAIILLRSIVAWVIAKPLERLLRRSGQSSLDDAIRKIVVVPTGYLLLALAIDISARILEVNASGMVFVIHITRTLVIIAIALVIYRLVDVLIVSRRELSTLTGITIDEALLPLCAPEFSFW